MDHTFTEDDLLSYIHGAAPKAVASRIEKRMDQDGNFKAEIAVMRGMKSALASDEGQNHSGEFGWHRLQVALEREENKDRRPGIAQRVGGWRAVAAVLGIMVLGQAVYIATGPVDPARFQTASKGVQNHVLAVRFKDDAAIAAIGDLIRALDGRIIDGPGASGIFRMEFATQEALRAAEADLETSPLITLLAIE